MVDKTDANRQFVTLSLRRCTKRAAAELAASGHRVEVLVGTDELVRYLGGL
jgi:hypothetical protein